MKKLIVVIIFFIINNIVLSQNFNTSFIFESVGNLTRIENRNIKTNYNSNNGYETEINITRKNLLIGGLGAFYSAKWNINNKTQIEIRPGFIFSSNVFSVIQSGIFLRYFFISDLFASTGIITELHVGGSGHDDPVQFPIFLSLQLGKSISKNISFLMSLNKTTNSFYYKKTQSLNSPIETYFYSILQIKAGVEFNL